MTLRLVWLVAATAAVVTASAQQPAPAGRQPAVGSPTQAGAPGAPQPSPPTGLILGRAIDAVTSRPLAAVTVAVASGAPGGPALPAGATRVLTDTEGRFVLRDLPAGTFTITATKPGYVAGAYGKRSASGTGQPLELGDDDRRGDVTIALWKYGVIGGRVVDEASEPMPGVQVRVLRRSVVAGEWRLSQTANQPTTDDRGLYRIDSLVPGQYIVGVVSAVAAMPTDLYENYVQAVSSGTSSEFSRSVDPAASLSPGAAFRMGDQVVLPGMIGIGAAQSLPVAPEDGARLFVYPTLFYPSVPTVTQAELISVAPGSERPNIDFQLRPAPSLTISGSVLGPDGPLPNTALQLLPSGAEVLQREYGFEAATTVSNRRGGFTFLGVVPGQYLIRVVRTPQRPQSTSSGITSVVQVGSTTITSFSTVGQAQPPIPTEPTLSGALSVSVGQNDVSGLTVVLHPGARIAGRVEFNGSAQKPAPAALAQISLLVDPSDGHSAGSLSSNSLLSRLQVDAQGLVHSYQFPAGKYTVRSGGVVGWTFAGAFLDGKDVSVTPFELSADVEGLVVKYTDRPGELSGTVRDDSRAVDRSVGVLLFPADPREWRDYGLGARRFRSIATSTGGTYRLSNMADGDYFVVAVSDDIPEWQDVSVLKKLAPLGVRVSISQGDKKVQDLKVGVLR